MSSAMNGPRSAEHSFRPDIEGMRGVAVLLVVLFHCRVPGFQGGFIGVDVFFGLSGYLITGLIVKEIERTGKLSFRNFYARRVRRLLPASGFVVVSTLLLGWFVYSPLELASYAKWGAYTSIYASNFMFMREAANYFARDSALNPYLHTWSLAVEEQFYLFWPVLIVLAMTRLKSRRRLALILGGVCAFSFAVCIWLTHFRQPWAFFSLPTRAWEFALGGLACLLSREQLTGQARKVGALGWAGLALVVASGCLYSPQMSFPGYAAMMPIAGTAMVLMAGALGARTALQTFLGTSVLQHLGRLSYSWYLWHWPALLAAEACFPNLVWRGRILAALIALGLAQMMFTLLERPIRFSRFLVARPAWSLTLALFVPLIGISAAVLVQKKAVSALGTGEQATFYAAAHDTRVLFDANCLTPAGVARVRQCEYGDRDSRTTLILFGDSHAEHWFPAFDAIARTKGLRLVTLLKSSCPAARVTVYSVTLKREDFECTRWREAALARIATMKPYMVILSEKDSVVSKNPVAGAGRLPISAEQWKEGLRSTLSYLNGHDLKVLVIADVPRAPFDVPTCLSRAAAHAWGAQDCVIYRDHALNLDARQAENAAVQDISGARLVDFTEKFCPGSVCQSTIAGQVVYRDSNHMTSSFAQEFVPLLEQQMDSLVGEQQRN